MNAHTRAEALRLLDSFAANALVVFALASEGKHEAASINMRMADDDRKKLRAILSSGEGSVPEYSTHEGEVLIDLGEPGRPLTLWVERGGDVHYAYAGGNRHGTIRAKDVADAVYSEFPLPIVPDGYVVVPREPTPEMLVEGFLSEDGGFDIETPADAPGLVYRAMLAAAPPPPNGETK